MKNIKKFILIFTLIIFGFLFLETVNSQADAGDKGPNTKTGASDINPHDTSVVVHNADEFIDACIKSINVYDNRDNDKGVSTVSENFYANSDTNGSSNGQNGGNTNITNIKLANDIDLTASSYGRYYKHRSIYGGPDDGVKISGMSKSIYDYYYTYVRHNGNITVDGDGHRIDFGFNNIAIKIDNQNWTFKNITIYGQSFYGPLSTNNDNCNVTYDNVKYYGAQLIHSWSPSCKVNIYNNVEVHSILWYRPLLDKDEKDNVKYYSETWGTNKQTQDEQNMEVNNVEFHENSHYFGETYGGNVLELSGNMEVDEGAQVELHPHRYGTGGQITQNQKNGNSTGIVFLNNSSLNVYKNAGIVIDCYHDDLTTNSGEKINSDNPDSKWISVAIDATTN